MNCFLLCMIRGKFGIVLAITLTTTMLLHLLLLALFVEHQFQSTKALLQKELSHAALKQDDLLVNAQHTIEKRETLESMDKTLQDIKQKYAKDDMKEKKKSNLEQFSNLHNGLRESIPGEKTLKSVSLKQGQGDLGSTEKKLTLNSIGVKNPRTKDVTVTGNSKPQKDLKGDKNSLIIMNSKDLKLSQKVILLNVNRTKIRKLQLVEKTNNQKISIDKKTNRNSLVFNMKKTKAKQIIPDMKSESHDLNYVHTKDIKQTLQETDVHQQHQIRDDPNSVKRVEPDEIRLRAMELLEKVQILEHNVDKGTKKGEDWIAQDDMNIEGLILAKNYQIVKTKKKKTDAQSQKKRAK